MLVKTLGVVRGNGKIIQFSQNELGRAVGVRSEAGISNEESCHGPRESESTWRYTGGTSQHAGTEVKPLRLADCGEQGTGSQQEEKRQQEDVRGEPEHDGGVQREEQAKNRLEQGDEPGVEEPEEHGDTQQEEHSEAQRKESCDVDEEVGDRPTEETGVGQPGTANWSPHPGD
ncbi:hypothetical protein NDU88_001637 [Pleurodeles waltl]|uniref:Uncharacterized protein n=1 Tax=Pleurodeles waltl TaxID=8319 RepID=A0AAV7RBU6_PLEWA|nr:hypothetical protein NDU88_001637 [Pleurodeles waltl]